MHLWACQGRPPWGSGCPSLPAGSPLSIAGSPACNAQVVKHSTETRLHMPSKITITPAGRLSTSLLPTGALCTCPPVTSQRFHPAQPQRSGGHFAFDCCPMQSGMHSAHEGRWQKQDALLLKPRG